MQIKGMTVYLYEKEADGLDAFSRPLHKESRVPVENVIVSPVSAEASIDALDINGSKVVYELCIPKGDTHEWADRKVEFYGQYWHTVGDVKEYMEEMVPLDWNKKVKVERYG